MHKYETNLASEFYVLAALYRLGADAALSLGNKKAVDITIVRSVNDVVTVDVKGVAGKHDWPADNIGAEAKPRHFVVFVSFEGEFSNPEKVPSIWVVPHADVAHFKSQYQSRCNVSRKRLLEMGERYRDNWDSLVPRVATT
jgi:hypothetical protein